MPKTPAGITAHHLRLSALGSLQRSTSSFCMSWRSDALCYLNFMFIKRRCHRQNVKTSQKHTIVRVRIAIFSWRNKHFLFSLTNEYFACTRFEVCALLCVVLLKDINSSWKTNTSCVNTTTLIKCLPKKQLWACFILTGIWFWNAVNPTEKFTDLILNRKTFNNKKKNYCIFQPAHVAPLFLISDAT